MLTDLFAASEEALPDYRRAGFPDPRTHRFPVVAGRGLDPVTLAVLDMLVSDASWQQAIDDALLTPDDDPDLYTRPVVTVLSSRVVRALPVLAPDELAALAADWSEQPELDSRTPAAIESWLGEAAGLCREAAANDHLVFVWNCL